ncbi:MAG: response regulator [Lachnospiraceae bacterium]|nr:response regulator [Lachnospiraceae bacterium]
MGFENVFSDASDDDFWNEAGFPMGTGFNSGFPSGLGTDNSSSDSLSPDGFAGLSDDFSDLMKVTEGVLTQGEGDKKKKILLVAREQTFMVNAIKKSLQDEDFDVFFAQANIAAVSSIADRPHIVIFYVDNADKAAFGALNYFKEILQGDFDACSVYLVGNENELEDAYYYLPKDFTKGSFPRPLNVKNLVSKLQIDQAFGNNNQNKKKVLVVDDDPIMLRTLKAWLEGKYQVFMANSGANALALLARNRVDLVLLDFEMPVISGAKVLEMIRTEPSTSTIPVMFLTAKDDAKSVLSVRDLHPERYLLKTMPPNELLKVIGSFFAKQDGQ